MQFAVVVKILHEPDRLHEAGGEFVDVHRFLVKVTGVKEFDLKGKFVGGPKRVVVAEAYLPVFVVIELVGFEVVGMGAPGVFDGFVGALFGRFGDVIKIDFQRLHPGRSRESQRNQHNAR